MILSLLLSLSASASFQPGVPGLQPKTPYQQCVDTCLAWEVPGYQLRACVEQCLKQQTKPIKFRPNGNCEFQPEGCENVGTVKAFWQPPVRTCEFHEEGCPQGYGQTKFKSGEWCETYEEDCERPDTGI